MRLSLSLLLVLPVSFPIAAVAAVPSPLDQQHPLNTPAWPTKPRWRKLSDTIIDAIFPHHDDKEHTTPEPGPADRRPPPPKQLLAQYGGDVVLRFNISSAEDAQSLAEAADTLLLDVWEFSHDWVDIRLSMDIVAHLLGLLPASLRTAHAPLLRERDLAQAIYDTYPTSRKEKDQSPFSVKSPSYLSSHPHNPTSLKTQDGPEGNLFFADYQPLSVIEPWMRLLESLFSTHVRRITIGKSHLGRDISALRIGVHPTNSEQPQSKRKTILVMGGLHAREWISTSTVNYVAYSLITSYGKTPSITALLEAFDFVFVPTINPDGYAYTWDSDRLWRKNRQPTSFRFCQGIDLDRSFGFQWDGMTTTIDNPCSESYAGRSPFQAVESKALADWARNETESNNVEFVGLLDLHSYSQTILYPYSYSCTTEPPGLENLEELAFGLGKAIRRSHGHAYDTMPACEGNFAMSQSKAAKKTAFPRMEASGGSALDYFYHDVGVKYAYQLKLRDHGTYGFLLPRSEIIPTGEEIYDATLYFAEFLRGVYEVESSSPSSASNDKDEEKSAGKKKVEESQAEAEGEDIGEKGDVDDDFSTKLDLKRRRKR